MGLKSMVIDAWSWLNYKPIYSDPALGMPNRRAFPEAHASWVPAADERRLAAYKVLAAYDNNQAGELAQIRDGDTARERREFGDPSMFVDTLVAHVLGREQHIVVPGAEQTPGAGQADAAAARVQELLRTWAENELLGMRMLQAERKAVGLGDAVYLLYWDGAKRRVRLKTYDPGFFFPVLPEDGDGSDFPERVHFAWELPEDKKRGLKPRLRRITYELGWIGPRTASGVDRTGRPVRAPVMSDPTDDAPATPVIGLGDTVDPATGGISRQYPWNDEPAWRTCYLTDATWELGDLKGPVDVDTLPLDRARYATSPDGEVLDRLDLYLDFIPVIHQPNTVPPAEEHWGQSSLAKALQVFDELASADTDSSRASATTGLPMIGISGVSDPRAQYDVAPGAVWMLGADGKLTSIDTSPALRELRDHRHDLADRAANVVRLPAVSLGTMDPSKVPSGYALELSLGPLDSLIDGMRLARDHKDMLLLRMVQRIHHAGQHPDWIGLPVQPARLIRGPYTPTDKAAVLEQVTAGVGKVFSLETAVRMLTEAGFPIDDAQSEIEQIESRQFEQARFLADALGNPEEVARFLGRQAPDTAQAPQPILPTEDDNPDGEDDEDLARGSGGNT
ncbi:hypothetical protein [Streptomyces sp. t39]|uniref:hypothetical protein n=1 Tax=Streptomyces sp. t39 TaxID=1828156 RepID=UPI0011CE50A4|nr:hypothetical protein [Streptomyces sp. t39]TXS42930.1 hypothetical protein EAO77_35325 [Streptomyces sp. t39]